MNEWLANQFQGTSSNKPFEGIFTAKSQNTSRIWKDVEGSFWRMIESGFRKYGGQINTAFEIEKKRMWKLDREVSVMAFGYNANKKISLILKRCNSYVLMIRMCSMASTSNNTGWLNFRLLEKPARTNYGFLYITNQVLV
jgi:hypothetical protein